MKTDTTLFEDINVNVGRLQAIIKSFLEQRNSLRATHKEEIDKIEAEMLEFLWECKIRGLLSTAKIARMIGLSRQRLYEKWDRLGHKPED